MLLAGGMLGLGVFLLLMQAIPAAPALGPALRRLHPVAGVTPPPPMVGWLRRYTQVPHTDLRLLGRTPEQYYLTLGLSALLALAFPALLTIAVIVLRIPIPPAIPAGGAILASLGAAWLAHREVLTKATAARNEFRRAMCTYLDLAAHQVIAGHGPVESLDRAASICQGWVFARTRDSLLNAQLQLSPPWDQLKALSRDIEVIELGDLADIMRTAGSDGADVYDTLRARADSLRDQLRTEALAEAELRTSKLDVPAAALIFIVLVLVIYPFMTQLFQH
ncbi:type II secretion system F family protein [Micromonospora sp. NPDC049900]|uniref:type II secretion system F family protein n=1 Tax=Micromonospora sp. NPDC049900 TaxID=3364275 RepID=UPI0037B1A7AD